MFLAAGFASFACLLSHPRDFGIFKIVIFSRALIAFLHLISESGLIEAARPSAEETRWLTPETFVTMVTTMFISYMYTWHFKVLPPQVERMVKGSSGLWPSEVFGFTAVRAISEIKESFPEIAKAIIN